MNGENLKAYFRKASAQKSLKLYELALNAAECGERKAANLEKKEVSFKINLEESIFSSRRHRR